MKLDRNVHERGLGKYALLKLRKLTNFTDPNDPFQEVAKPIAEAIQILEKAGILDWGDKPESEFFVMRLKDKYARCALHTYAEEAWRDGETEFSAEVGQLANRAGSNHPNCKKPD